MRSVEEHQRVVAELITARAATSAELAAAEGLVLSDDVTATLSLPLFDNSAWTVTRCTPRGDLGNRRASSELPVAEDIPAGRIDVPTLAPGRLIAS